jgi:cytochrome P450
MKTLVQSAPGMPPGPRPLPGIGNLLGFFKEKHTYFQRLQQIYGDIVTVHMGTEPFIFLFRPEFIKYVLTENPQNFINGKFTRPLIEVMGNGLITMDGEEHRQQRRVVQPAFQRKRVDAYDTIMVRHSAEMIKNWKSGQEIELTPIIHSLMLSNIIECIFGVSTDPAELQPLALAFSDVIDNHRSVSEFLFSRLPWTIPYTHYARRVANRRMVDTFIYDLIAQRRTEAEPGADVLSMLLSAEHPCKLTDTQIHDHMLTLTFAGHETSADALLWTFHLLAEHEPVRKKLIAEIQHVLGDRLPTADDLPQIPYGMHVLEEAMRLYPPTWLLGRTAIEAVDLGGYHFPAGTTFVMTQWTMNRHPGIWKDAEEFRPERWENEIPQWTYFPFGGGPRICMGMPFAWLALKLALIVVSQRYELLSKEGFHKRVPSISMRPKGGLPMKIQALQHS